MYHLAGVDAVALVKSADVVVIGAGVAGLCVARLLAEAHTSVVVLEADEVASGASGQCAGHVLMGVVEHPGRVAAALGLAGAKPLYELSMKSAEMLRRWKLLHHDGGRWCAMDDREPSDIEASHRTLEHYGIDSVVGEGPFGYPELRVAAEGGVLPAEGSGDLAASVARAGGHVLRGLRANAVADGPEGVVVHTDRGTVEGEVVVYAAGAGALGLEPYFDDKVVTVREQALEVRGRVRGGRAGHGYTWWSPRPDGTTVVGGCRWATPHLETSETVPVPVEAVQQRIEAFVPRLGLQPEVVRRWAWIEAHTCDGLPIVGPLPGTARHLACVGFVGNDWGLAPAAAAALVEGLVGSGPSRVEPLFAPTRFE